MDTIFCQLYFFYFSTIVIEGTGQNQLSFFIMYLKNLKNKAFVSTSDVVVFSAFKDKWSVF